MWSARVFNDQGWRSLSAAEVDGPFNSRALLEPSRKVVPPHLVGLSRYLSAEIENVEQAREAIELWGSRAAEESRSYDYLGGGKVEFFDGAIGLFSAKAEASQRPSTVAWHDLTSVIIPIMGESTIELRYEPGVRDESKVEQMLFRHGTAAHAVETILDWRGYFGKQSAVIDGWRLMRKSGHGYVASIRGTTGFVVGNVMRRLSDKQVGFTEDPTSRYRVEKYEQKHANTAAVVPRFRVAPPLTTASATIFIHGTVSCGLACLKDLYDGGAAGRMPLEPTFRYEHDTFLPLQQNGSDLADRVREVLRVKRLNFVAHSRGGLVARYARRNLQKSGYPAEINVLTVGTPHLGTPVVRLAGRALNMFLKLGEDVLNAVPVTSPLIKAYSILWDVPGLPAGIAGMEENSDAILTLNEFDSPDRMQAFGSSFDIMNSPHAYGVDFDLTLMGFMNDREHDLVVPLESALGFGNGSPALNCSHSDYFKAPLVQQAVAKLQAPVA